MKAITKIGTGAIICGAVFSAIGGIVCALNYNQFSNIYLGEPVSYEKDIDKNISELDIDVSFLNIDIKHGDKLKITADEVPEKLLPDIDISDKKLSINDKDFTSRLKEKDLQLGSINDEFVGTFTIYIPDTEFKEVNIDSAFSSLEISELNADKINIECSFGEYILKDSECNKLDFACSFGDSSISDTKCHKADFANSFGNFDSENLKISQSGNIANSFGDMNINLSGDNYKFDIITSMGSSDTFSCPSEDVKIEASNSFGNISFTN